MKEKTPSVFFEARLKCIETAFRCGFKIDDPDKQSPQWLREGVRLRKKGVKITPDTLDAVDRWGGTDHPDPYFN